MFMSLRKLIIKDRQIRHFFVGLFSVSLLLSHAVVAASESLILGLHPYLPEVELQERFKPLATYLSEKIGRTIEVRVAESYQEHIEEIGQNHIDIAYIGPAPYVKMVEQYGHKPLLARLEIEGKAYFHGRIVVRVNSPIQQLVELQDKRFAFGDRNSTMSHLVPRYTLTQAGIDMDKLRFEFLQAHNNVALSVLAEDFDAGAVKDEVYLHYKERGLRELAKTEAISEHLFVTREDLSEGIVKSLRTALYQLGDEKEDEAIMRAIKDKVTGFAPVKDCHYDNLREIMKVL